jgi:hypothetical protein
MTNKSVKTSIAGNAKAIAILFILFSGINPPTYASWEPNTIVYGDAYSSGVWQWMPSLAVDLAGNLYCVWMAGENGDRGILFSYRPYGEDWQTNVKISDDTGPVDHWSPSIAVNRSGNAYCVWDDSRNGNLDIYFSYRPSGGNWQPNVKVNDNSDTTSQWHPSIAVDQTGNAYSVWIDNRNGNPDVYFSYRPAGGNWQSNIRVNDDPGTAGQWCPAIAVDTNGNAFCAWHDDRNGNRDIYFAFRPNGGNWGANMKVSDDLGINDQWYPSIAVDDNSNAYCAWMDKRDGHWDIFSAYRPANGSWMTNKKVNDGVDTLAQKFPSIAVDQTGNAYCVWEDGRNGNSDIYFSYCLSGGNWEMNGRVDDDTTEERQFTPSLTVDSDSNAHCVWYDFRRGIPEVYYARRRGTGIVERSRLDAFGVGLKGIYPNPTGKAIDIKYELRLPALISLEIYDVSGRKVSTLGKGAKNSGLYTVRWEGTANDGKRVPNGIYLIRLKIRQDHSFSQTEKTVIIQR